MYHHAREFDHILYGEITQAKCSTLLPEPQCKDLGVTCWSWPHLSSEDQWHDHRLQWEPCYEWMRERVGFYPLFLAVGDTDDDIRMTGYQSNWRRWILQSKAGTEWVKPGESSNQVLFSWNESPHPQLTYSDYGAWHIVLGAIDHNYAYHQPFLEEIPPYWERAVFKRSYRPSDWKRMARLHPASVQAVVPSLDLRTCDQVWCRSKKVKKQLVEMGWDSQTVEVRRIPVD